VKRREVGPRHIYIPDTQIKPGVPTDHLLWAARYVAHKRPQRLIFAGDWADMQSLSSYDKGKLSAQGRFYQDDVDAANDGMDLFFGELKKVAPRGYKPDKHLTLGNHEGRITRHVEANPELKGKVGLDDLNYKDHGVKVHPFLKPVILDGITYIHYCPLNAKGRVYDNKMGAPGAEAQAKRMMRTTVCGHRQGLDVATIETPGKRIRGVIAGSFYQHEEGYMTPLGNSHWQGILVFNDIHDGDFDLVEVSLDYLARRYG
jgi:hypothetical protein